MKFSVSPKFLFKIFKRSIIWIVLIALAVVAGFFIGKEVVYHEHPELTQSDQAQTILNKVSAVMVLPTGETPVMATITDATSVRKAQPLLAQAKDGDILIVYTHASEAILYRPSINKIIVVGPVGTQPAPDAQVSAPVTPTPKSDATSTPVSTSTQKVKP